MGKTYIYVDEEIAGKIELIEDILKLKGEDISKAIEKLANDTDAIKTDNIDTTLLELKLHAQRVRDEYKKCVDEEIEKTSILWEECDGRICESRTKIKAASSVFSELSRSIELCASRLKEWDMKKFSDAMDLIDRYNNFTSKEKLLLKSLMAD